MDEDVVKTLRDILKQMEAQHEAIVNLTDVLGKYLAIPIKVDADNSPVSFQEGSAVSINNKPTVAAEQAGNWNVSAKRAIQNSDFKVLVGTAMSGITKVPDLEIEKFKNEVNKETKDGWEVINVTTYPWLFAFLKKPL